MDTFITYLQGKGLSRSTQELYSYNIGRFLEWYPGDPIGCSKKDILNYLDHLQNTRRMQNASRRTHLIALDHYYRSMGLHEVTSFIKLRGTKKKRLRTIFSSEELIQLHDDHHHNLIQDYQRDINHTESHSRIILLSRQRNHAMLGLLVHQGLATSELDLLHINDLDLLKAKLTMERKGRKRTLPLHASQIGALMHYIEQVRPQFLDGKEETGKLFLPLAERACTGKANLSIKGALRTLVAEARTLHPKLAKITQLRASVIAHWIKAEGLRKAQYLAGHGSINSTEEYQPDNLEELTEELAKFNPF